MVRARENARMTKRIGFQSYPRRGALATAAAGGAGSLGLMFYAGRHNPSVLLMLLFVGWVGAPFAVLVWANLVSSRYGGVTIALTAGSLAIYGAMAFGMVQGKM